MIAHIAGLPVEELSTLAFGGTAGWTLLYLFGRLGEVAERVAAPRDERPGDRRVEPRRAGEGRPSRGPARTSAAQAASGTVTCSPGGSAAPAAVRTGITSCTAPAEVAGSDHWRVYQAT